MGHKFVYRGERSRMVFHYCLDWSSRICKAAFCAVTNCKAKIIKLLQKSFSDRDVAPRMQGNSKSIPYNAISVKDKSIVVNIIQKHAAIHGLPDPGHLKGPIQDYVLESNVTKREVYKKYCQAMLIQASPQSKPTSMVQPKSRLYTLVHTNASQSVSTSTAASS